MNHKNLHKLILGQKQQKMDYKEFNPISTNPEESHSFETKENLTKW